MWKMDTISSTNSENSVSFSVWEKYDTKSSHKYMGEILCNSDLKCFQ